MKVQYIAVEIKFEGLVDRGEVDIGSVNLCCEGREYSMDVCQSYTDDSSGDTNISCDLEEDREVLDDCNYQLQAEDFINPKLVADIYIGGEFSSNIESATLFVKLGEITKAIDLSTMS
jgi:hypothetical protein